MERLKESRQKAQVKTYSTVVGNRFSLNEDGSSWEFQALGVRTLIRTRLTTKHTPGSSKNTDPRLILPSEVPSIYQFIPEEKPQPDAHLARSDNGLPTNPREKTNFPKLRSSPVETEIKSVLDSISKLKFNQSADPCDSLNYITKSLTHIFKKYIMLMHNSDHITDGAPSLSTTKSPLNQ